MNKSQDAKEFFKKHRTLEESIAMLQRYGIEPKTEQDDVEEQITTLFESEMISFDLHFHTRP